MAPRIKYVVSPLLTGTDKPAGTSRSFSTFSHDEYTIVVSALDAMGVKYVVTTEITDRNSADFNL